MVVYPFLNVSCDSRSLVDVCHISCNNEPAEEKDHKHKRPTPEPPLAMDQKPSPLAKPDFLGF